MLGGAQKIILLIFVILLIVIFGIVLWTFIQGDIESWPPTTQTCPDYWIESANGECSQLLTVDGVKCESYMPSDPCNNYKWSTDTCKTPWDGINYGYGKYTPCEAGYNPSKL